MSARLIATASLLVLIAFGCAPHTQPNPVSTTPQASTMPTEPRIPEAVLEMQKSKTKGNQ